MNTDKPLSAPALDCDLVLVGIREPVPGSAARLVARKLAACAELTKPRITLLILLVAMAAFWIGSPGVPEFGPLLTMVVGVSLLAGGIFALNQYLERNVDALMRRTENRPLPTGRLSGAEAQVFGIVLSALAVLWFAWQINTLSAVLAVFTLGSYLLLYTPLKTRTPHCTLVGAFPGATPPLFGWAAVRGELGVEAWMLFAILFLWQFPHFHSIAWIYREDYARADIRMWPVIEPDGRTTIRQVIGFTLALLPASVLPGLAGISGWKYAAGAAVLGGWLLWSSSRIARSRTKQDARRLLLATVLYLPALFGLMVLGKR